MSKVIDNYVLKGKQMGAYFVILKDHPTNNSIKNIPVGYYSRNPATITPPYLITTHHIAGFRELSTTKVSFRESETNNHCARQAFLKKGIASKLAGW